MQSFGSINDFFLLDAYFFPPANDTGFESVASSSFHEPVVLPSEFDRLLDLDGINGEPSSFRTAHDPQQYPSAYYPNNFLPIQGFSLDGHPTPLSNVRRERHTSAIPVTKPPVRKTRVQNRKRLSEKGRIKYLQNDEYVLSFGETWVTCSGCRKRIKLDSRNGARYYPGFWDKHKERCLGVEEKMTAARRREKEEAERCFSKLTVEYLFE